MRPVGFTSRRPGPLNRGALVSKYLLDRQGRVLAGARAYDFVYLDDRPIGPAANSTNNTRGFARFCSAFLGGPEHGFDRYIYFANEESGGSDTFDGTGGLSVAIFDNEAHGLTCLGRFAWENTLVQPNRHGNRVVIMEMEDGPASQNPAESNSQLQEDGTTESRAVMAQQGRDGSIWRLKLRSWPGYFALFFPGVSARSAERVVELAPTGRDGRAVGPGVWETSGIIAADGLFGAGSWLFDVQAHAPTVAPAPNSVEDGQLLLLMKAKRSSDQ